MHIHTCIHMYVYVCIYYKDLAHVIMEADKSPDLQSASGSPRRAEGVVPVQRPTGLRPKRVTVSLRVQRQENMDFSAWRPSGRRNSLLFGGVSAYCSTQAFTWLDEAHPLGRAICFTQSIDLNIKHTQNHPHRNTQNNVWPSMNLVTYSGWHMKLTITST